MITVSIQGVNYSIPEAGDPLNGGELTRYLVALSGSNFSPVVNQLTKLRLADTNITITSDVASHIITTTSHSVFRLSSSAPYTLNTSTPFTAGLSGDIIYIFGVSDNGITIMDSGNVDLRGTITLKTNDCLTLIYSTSAGGKWLEVSRNT